MGRRDRRAPRARLLPLAAALVLFAGCAALPSAQHARVLRYEAPVGEAGDYRLRRDGSDLVLDERRSARELARSPLARLDAFELRSAADVDDVLTVDLANGAFALPGGVDFDGGARGYDTLAVRGDGGEAQHRGFDAHSGEMLLGGGLRVRYANLEPTFITGMSTVTVSGTDAAQTIAIVNGTGDRVRVDISGAESTEIDDVTNLIVRGGMSPLDVADTITINFSNVSTGLQSLTVEGDDTSPNSTAADRINVVQVPLAVATTLRGNGGNDTFAFSAGAAINGLIDGQGGTDLLDHTAATASVAVNLGLAANLAAVLTAADEVPPNSGTPSGTATVTYDPVAKNFDISVAVSGISAPNGFHIHRAAVGLNGPIVIDFGTAVTPDGSGGFTFSANDVPLGASLSEAQFLGGQSYLNVHTSTFPGGAIRGQLFPVANIAVGASATGMSALNAIENASGGTGADSLIGSFQGNVLNGGGGNDTLIGGPGADTLNGDAGDDALVWNNGDGSDVIEGGANNDTVHVNGSDLTETYALTDAGARIDFDRVSPGPFSLDIGSSESLNLNARGGDDSITAGALGNLSGTTRLSGFAGTDSLDIDATVYGDLRLHGGDGNDTVLGPAPPGVWGLGTPIGSSTLLGVIDGLQLTERVVGGAGDDNFAIGPGAAFTGGVDGGGGSDTLDYSGFGSAVAVNLGLGVTGLAASMGEDQEVPPTGVAASAVVTGTYNLDTRTIDLQLTATGLAPAAVTGFHLHRAATGVNGPIILDLGTGSLVAAGDGFTFNAIGVAVPAAHEAALLGGFTYLNVHTAGFPAGAIRGQLFGTGNVNVPASASATAFGSVAGIENVIGGAQADSLVGNTGANRLEGEGGADMLLGGPGSDTLEGDAGADGLAWNNGDGSDVVEGGSEVDALQVNGSASSNDVFAVAPNGARIDFDRLSPGPFSLDVGGIERLIAIGNGGDDAFELMRLAGVLDLTQVQLHGLVGVDDFLVQASPGIAVAVHGGVPASVPGDDLVYDRQYRLVSGDLVPPDGNIVSTGVADVAFFGIESFVAENAEQLFADGFEEP